MGAAVAPRPYLCAEEAFGSSEKLPFWNSLCVIDDTSISV